MTLASVNKVKQNITQNDLFCIKLLKHFEFFVENKRSTRKTNGICLNFQLIGINHDKVLQRINANTSNHNQSLNEKSASKSVCKKTKTNNTLNRPNDVFVPKYGVDDFNFPENNSLIKVKILYETNDLSENISQTTVWKSELSSANAFVYKCDKNDNSVLDDTLIKGQTLLTSYFRPIPRNPQHLIEPQIKSIDREHDNSFELVINCDNEEIDTKQLLLCRKRIRRKYHRLNVTKYQIRSRTIAFFVQVAHQSRKQFSVQWRQLRNKHVAFAYKCFVLFQRFVIALRQQNQHVINDANGMTTEAIVNNRRVQKLLNDNNTNMRETHEENTPTTHGHNDVGAKRLPKHQRTSDNSRLLLLTDNAQESSEKDFGK